MARKSKKVEPASAKKAPNTVKKLRKALKKRGLNTKGLKAELVARFNAAEAEAAEPASPPAEADVTAVTKSAEEPKADTKSMTVVDPITEAIVKTYPERRAQAPQVRDLVTTGPPKSGRKWKMRQATRASAAGIVKNKSAWDVQMKRKRAEKASREKEKEMVEKRRQKKIRKRERTLMNQRRKAENEMKSTSYQVINNTKGDKLKKMSKKQLKHIRKTSVRADGTVELVPVYQK